MNYNILFMFMCIILMYTNKVHKTILHQFVYNEKATGSKGLSLIRIISNFDVLDQGR